MIFSYLWFFMEPILAKADNYSFLKKLVENVKQTRDAQAPDDEEVNKVHKLDIDSYLRNALFGSSLKYELSCCCYDIHG